MSVRWIEIRLAEVATDETHKLTDIGTIEVDRKILIDILAIVLRYTSGVDERLAKAQAVCREIEALIQRKERSWSERRGHND